MSTGKAPKYKVYKDHRNEWRWTFHAANGEAIAVSSEGYTAERDCLHGIALMKSSNDAVVLVEE
ncbi:MULTISPECIES: YegP family protein [Azospirillum]|uniref:DUF1508 domain-containing protein n=2 Tax=Azospirillum TaxID=191 RepID=A0A6L3AV82_AZOBR|nr:MULTISPECIES: DUF1508 domain-containing protein [Azospirillum]KAA0681578.1 DUF1508 domain-containing protein [Azospirillum brasilense]MBK3800220.1 DUF1508 domain-containing protein [Azospirillum argentinense]NUB08511.1 DUF1508 domain-containing protein [Azospirillum baldaniorum]QCN96144.1 DUF1508 domain-containing protein [Azospirillum argentinense]TWA60469.1 hypothetical protein FBZ84_11447 [Azospirillum baldaniorum]